MDRFKLLGISIVLAAFVGVFAGAPPTSAQMPKSKGFEGKGFPGQKGAPGGGAAMQLPVIDTHVHLDVHVGRDRTDYEGAARVALDLMDQTGVRVALLMSPPLPPDRKGRYDDRAIMAVAQKFPGRFALMGGGATLNPMVGAIAADRVTESDRREFEAEANKILALGAVGFGEMAALHFSFFAEHPFEAVAPDHPLFLLLADIAARHDVPIDFHTEVVPEDMAVAPELRQKSSRNPTRVSANLGAFERMLAHNRAAKIVWTHAGLDSTRARSPALTRTLLQRHSNLYVSVNVHPGNVFNETVPMSAGGPLKPEWRTLLTEMPERFVIGSDQFNSAPNAAAGGFAPTLRPTLRVLQALPPDVARKIAVDNPQRIYKLAQQSTR